MPNSQERPIILRGKSANLVQSRSKRQITRQPSASSGLSRDLLSSSGCRSGRKALPATLRALRSELTPSVR